MSACLDRIAEVGEYSEAWGAANYRKCIGIQEYDVQGGGNLLPALFNCFLIIE